MYLSTGEMYFMYLLYYWHAHMQIIILNHSEGCLIAAMSEIVLQSFFFLFQF